jgi:hypothetical protein
VVEDGGVYDAEIDLDDPTPSELTEVALSIATVLEQLELLQTWMILEKNPAVVFPLLVTVPVSGIAWFSCPVVFEPVAAVRSGWPAQEKLVPYDASL